MKIALGCIADDFTGATDLAGLLARSGCPVSLRIGVPSDHEPAEAAVEVIALKIRTEPVQDAVDQVLTAVDWLRRQGAERFFWKYCSTFDSTAEGNIGPVAEAIMDRIGASQTIYCPAFPENERRVFMGHLFVGQQLLSDSPMKDHPLTPMTDSSLPRLLAPQVERDVGLIPRSVVASGAKAISGELARLAEAGVAHVITDAIEDIDLTAIAEAGMGLELMTGGSAVAAPLPGLLRQAGVIDGTIRNVIPEVSLEAIVLSGSASAMTNRQVAEYIDRGAASFRLDPVELSQGGTGPAKEWLASQDLSRAPLVYATASPVDVRKSQDVLGRGKAGQIVEDALAEIARTAFAAGARRFVVAGGETSGAVTQALGVSRLAVGAEIAPGVPWTYSSVEDENVALALKSGNFGKETFFADALGAL